MTERLVLASASATRRSLLENAGVPVDAVPARLDEEALRVSMQAEGISARDIADSLAEAKARKVSARVPGRLVLGCDQVLEHRGEALGKAADLAGLRTQLVRLRDDSHVLWSAAVLYGDGRPLWRQIGEARMTMAAFSDTYLDAYLRRHGDALVHTVGGYRIEDEGVRLFARIEGDHFTILGLPLMPLLLQFARMGVLET